MAEEAENELIEEIESERKGFDLIDRLVNRPKRKPEVVEVYLNEELGAELGYAVDQKNEYGLTVARNRSGALGDLDAERAKGDDADQKLIVKLEKQIKKLVEQIRNESMTFTLQWVPPVVEETIDREVRKSLGIKGKIAEERRAEYMRVWLDHALRATIVSLVDNASGSKKDKVTIAEANALRDYLPKSQLLRLDEALNKLLNRDSFSKEALDNADF